MILLLMIFWINWMSNPGQKLRSNYEEEKNTDISRTACRRSEKPGVQTPLQGGKNRTGTGIQNPYAPGRKAPEPERFGKADGNKPTGGFPAGKRRIRRVDTQNFGKDCAGNRNIPEN